MGFASNAAFATHFLNAYAQNEESRNIRRAASAQAALDHKQAESMVYTSEQNALRAQRNRNSHMAFARADAAASNLMDDGSARTRELDLATRLEDEITNNTNAALQQADAVNKQGILNAWDTRNQARQSKYRALGSALQGVGSLAGSVSSYL